jgi:hypothetical protein
MAINGHEPVGQNNGEGTLWDRNSGMDITQQQNLKAYGAHKILKAGPDEAAAQMDHAGRRRR